LIVVYIFKFAVSPGLPIGPLFARSPSPPLNIKLNARSGRSSKCWFYWISGNIVTNKRQTITLIITQTHYDGERKKRKNIVGRSVNQTGELSLCSWTTFELPQKLMVTSA